MIGAERLQGPPAEFGTRRSSLAGRPAAAGSDCLGCWRRCWYAASTRFDQNTAFGSGTIAAAAVMFTPELATGADYGRNTAPTTNVAAIDNWRMKIYLSAVRCVTGCLGCQASDRDYVVSGATPEQTDASGYQPVGKDFPVFCIRRRRRNTPPPRTERKSGRGYRLLPFTPRPM